MLPGFKQLFQVCAFEGSVGGFGFVKQWKCVNMKQTGDFNQQLTAKKGQRKGKLPHFASFN